MKLEAAAPRVTGVVRRGLPLLGLGVALLVGLYLVSRVNYLLFHSLAELFSIVISVTIFVLVWNGRGFIHNGYLTFFGLSFLFTAAIDLLHMLAYTGMGVFPGTAAGQPNAPNLATQLWIGARGLQALSLLIAPFLVQRRVRAWPTLALFATGTVLLLLTIFQWGIFPVMYRGGLTPIKIAAEFAIIAGFITGMLLLLRVRRVFVPAVLRLLLASIALNVLAELFFTQYLSVVDEFNLLGHFFKIVAFYLIYKAIIETSFIRPTALFLRELEQSRSALEASEARERARSIQLEAIMDAVPAVVWIAHDRLCRQVTGNRAAADLLRLTPEANQSLTAPEDQAPRHFKVYQNGRELLPEELPLQRTAATGIPIREFEESILFDDGQEVHMLGDVSPLLDERGQPEGAVAAFIDITERVKAIDALRQSEARLRRLVDSNMIGVMYTTEDGTITFANDRFLDLVGYTREEMEAGEITWRTLTPPEYMEISERGIAEAAQRGVCTPYEKEYARKDGVRVPVFIGYAYFAGSDPAFTCFVVDLSEQKRSQAAIRAYTTQLERSNRELARANAELQDFAFVASHDLQEPLRKIQAFGERLNLRMGGHVDDETADYLTRMLSAAGRMRTMINDLLSLSRVTTRGRPFERVDLNQVMEEVLSDLEITIERSGGAVHSESLPALEADPTQMRQLLQNLVANALKFRRDGVPPQVKVSGACQDGQVVVEVADNGIGFEEEYAERIFQPFQRLYGMSQFEGSGIGLAICRKIVERHGGAISARSQVGVGSTFTVTLPERQRDWRE